MLRGSNFFSYRIESNDKLASNNLVNCGCLEFAYR